MDAATQEWFDKGLAIRKEVLGAAYVDRALDGATDFDRPFQEFMTAQCWGMTWGREGLTRQQRSMNNLCILAALNRSTEFATHFRAAIGNGVTLTELRETLIQIATYCGVPAGVEAFRIVIGGTKFWLDVHEDRMVPRMRPRLRRAVIHVTTSWCTPTCR